MSNQYSEWEQYRVNPPQSENGYGDWEQYRVNNPAEDQRTISQDILKGLQDIPGYISEGAEAFNNPWEQLTGASQEGFGRFGLNSIAGLSKLGRNILNAPGNARDYAVKHDVLPDDSWSLRLPEEVLPRDYDYAKGVGLEGERPGDALVQGTFERLPSVIANRSPYALMFTEALNAIGNNKNPITASGPAAVLSALKNIGTLGGQATAEITKRVPGAIRSAKEFGQTFSKKGTADKIAKDTSNIQEEFKKSYDYVFNNAKEKGLTSVLPPDLKLKDFMKRADPAYRDTLKEYLNNPTLENAHKAQSQLGEFARNTNNNKKRFHIPTPKLNAAQEASVAQDKIQKSIAEELNKLGPQKNLGNKYQYLTSDYAQRMGPRLRNDIRLYAEGKKKPGTLLKNLTADEEFMLSQTGEMYPGITRSRMFARIIDPVMNKIGAGPMYQGYKTFSGE